MQRVLLLTMTIAPSLLACASGSNDDSHDANADDLSDTRPADDTRDTHPDDMDIADDTRDTPSDDLEVADGDIEGPKPCWPAHDEVSCKAADWKWYIDYATNYCPDPDQYCPPPTAYAFCALPCEDDDDCKGTTVPHCGRIGYWGGSDSFHSSPFKVCVPIASSYEWDYYSPRPSETCQR
ncbi:MAG: hypothetical protein JNJ59_02375 [Deltaproteobacteria bacterium]|nr:hypothetical protein [Deltaproteobacteria bacterium]